MATIDENNYINLVGKKIGPLRVVKRGEQTYTTPAKRGPIKNDRHTAQMESRLLFNSVRVLWSHVKEAVEGNFELKSADKRDYNHFTKINSGCGVFFDKQEQMLRCSVITPLIFADGTLDPIGQHLDDQQRVVTSIGLGSMEITDETTIAEFSKAVDGSNGDISFGDEIVFVAAYQEMQNNLPCVRSERFAVKLDRRNSRKLQPTCGAIAFASHNGLLTSAPGLPTGCYGYCLVSNGNGQRKVSTQRLLNNNREMLAQYTSKEKFDEACNSYGGCNDALLNPGLFKPLDY